MNTKTQNPVPVHITSDTGLPAQRTPAKVSGDSIRDSRSIVPTTIAPPLPDAKPMILKSPFSR
jgi:hypothetical protein